MLKYLLEVFLTTETYYKYNNGTVRRSFIICILEVRRARRMLQFVAHPNVQQLLASIWYESVPGFRRKNMLLQAAEMVRIGAMFPLYSLAYIVAPHSSAGRTLRKPFIKFLCHSASYFMFLCKILFYPHYLRNKLSSILDTNLNPLLFQFY